MRTRVSLAWRQLAKEKLRFAVAASGAAFAVILVSMQLGFRSAMYDGAIRYHRHLRYDLVMLNPKTPFIGFPRSFSRRRLYQCLGSRDVASVTAVHIAQAFWKNPWEHNARNILVVGFDPAHDALDLPEVRRRRDALRRSDAMLFDAASRPEFGPVANRFLEAGRVAAEVNDRRVEVVGLFELGTSFGIDGSLVTSDLNFQRLFPERAPGLVEVGLIELRRGVEPGAARRRLAAALERDVDILTRDEFAEREVRYWGETTPIGYVFSFGALMGLLVGGVVVYQILYADVSEHLAEYATLKAMGYTNRALASLVLQEASILAVSGFVPGMAVAVSLYRITARATRLPLAMTPGRALAVLLLTFAMCSIAGLVALRRVRAADPAEIFG